MHAHALLCVCVCIGGGQHYSHFVALNLPMPKGTEGLGVRARTSFLSPRRQRDSSSNVLVLTGGRSPVSPQMLHKRGLASVLRSRLLGF